MERKSILIIMMVTTLSLILTPTMMKGRKHEPVQELCELNNVFIEGNSESASIARRELEKRTWLKLENDREKAAAILSVSESRSPGRGAFAGETVTASAELKKGAKLLWSDSATGAVQPLISGASGSVKVLLGHLRRDAACK